MIYLHQISMGNAQARNRIKAADFHYLAKFTAFVTNEVQGNSTVQYSTGYSAAADSGHHFYMYTDLHFLNESDKDSKRMQKYHNLNFLLDALKRM